MTGVAFEILKAALHDNDLVSSMVQTVLKYLSKDFGMMTQSKAQLGDGCDAGTQPHSGSASAGIGN